MSKQTETSQSPSQEAGADNPASATGARASYRNRRAGTAQATNSGQAKAAAVRASWLRTARTIVLGAIAVVAGLFWLGDQYGISRDMMLEYLVASLIFVGALVGAAGTLALLLIGFKKLFGSDS